MAETDLVRHSSNGEDEIQHGNVMRIADLSWIFTEIGVEISEGRRVEDRKERCPFHEEQLDHSVGDCKIQAFCLAIGWHWRGLTQEPVLGIELRVD